MNVARTQFVNKIIICSFQMTFLDRVIDFQVFFLQRASVLSNDSHQLNEVQQYCAQRLLFSFLAYSAFGELLLQRILLQLKYTEFLHQMICYFFRISNI